MAKDAAPSSSASSSAVEAPPAAEAKLQGPWSEQQLKLMWEAVPRPLLKLGKAGASDTHLR